MGFVERLIGKLTTRTAERVLGIVSLVAVVVTAVMSLWVVPPDATQGDVQRLMYIHVPAAWLAFLAFFVVAAASVAYLVTKRTRYDRLAAASAEVGVLFTGLTIVIGSIWGKPIWGTWWTWDPRLTTTAILFLIYVGYLAVRRLPDSPAKKARWAAVIGIVGFLDVPIVDMSVTWWRSLHQGPSVQITGSATIAPIMMTTLLIGVGAFTVFYVYLLILRMRVGRLEEAVLAEALSPRLKAAIPRPDLLPGDPEAVSVEEEAPVRG